VTLATASAEERLDLQFGPDVDWFEFETIWSASTIASPSAPAVRGDDRAAGVVAMYARLAGAHAESPTVADRGGGVRGDRYPLDQ
jgi:hypothetical protein